MARPLRIEFPGAIHHVTTRGNGGQLLFHGPDHYQRMLGQTVRGQTAKANMLIFLAVFLVFAVGLTAWSSIRGA